ncbi:hypothetical protein [Corynebacterium sp.]|uniref:hypothetical protein n=1 Tax=Corynebacterium sp. TaxID=1720 RepID=UPI0026DA7BB4|nr:hypothetical protein [Corynebacterium sp.]MDO5031905.1 hypothetical protein [Corynebacterium sp.]
MSDNHAVADHASETYPEFSGKIQDSYIEGYEPVSYAAPHSSLLRTSTWVGMGLILSLLPAAGMIIWGWSTYLWPDGTAGADYKTSLVWGIIFLAVILVAGVFGIRYGRRYYRQYRKETGRVN